MFRITPPVRMGHPTRRDFFIIVPGPPFPDTTIRLLREKTVASTQRVALNNFNLSSSLGAMPNLAADSKYSEGPLLVERVLIDGRKTRSTDSGLA